jgi:flagellar biosynthesis/type III secretory pathway protein FliH
MTTITFDTHKFIRRLRSAGFEEAQAEAVAEAFQEAQAESLPVTRDYLDARLYELENRLVKWVIGVALGQFAMIVVLIKL